MAFSRRYPPLSFSDIGFLLFIVSLPIRGLFFFSFLFERPASRSRYSFFVSCSFVGSQGSFGATETLGYGCVFELGFRVDEDALIIKERPRLHRIRRNERSQSSVFFLLFSSGVESERTKIQSESQLEKRKMLLKNGKKKRERRNARKLECGLCEKGYLETIAGGSIKEERTNKNESSTSRIKGGNDERTTDALIKERWRSNE